MITIYTKDNCTYCVRAKNLMKSRQIAFQEVNVTHDIEGFKAEFPYIKTLPYIPAINGGYDQLVEKIAENSNFGKLLLNE